MKFLLYYHTGAYNRGCEAIVRTAVSEIKKQFPEAEIDLASFNPETDKVLIPIVNKVIPHKNLPIKKYSYHWFLSALHLKLLNDENYAYKVMFRDFLKKANQYDVLISVGGDNYCYGEIPEFYEVHRQLKKRNLKTILWGASVGQEDLTPAKTEDLKSFDLILARETLTEEVLKNAGCKNVKLVADGAFLMEKTELPLPEGFTENKTIGFNFSPLVAKKNPKAKQAVHQLIEHILHTTENTIALVPHVIMNGNNDVEILQEILQKYQETNRVFLLPDHLNATEYKGYIARMKFFIGARTHATIAAYATGVPTMVLGYSVKSKGIAKDIFGEEKLVLDIDEISNAEKLIAKFEEMKQEELMLQEILRNKIPHIKEMAQKAKSYLAEII